MNIYEELTKVQFELKAPKNLRNSFGGFNYRSAEDIYKALKPILYAHGLTLFVSDDIVEIGGKNYIQATCTLANFENQTIQVKALARECESKKGMDDSQLTGSTSSYARKYALNGLFLIDDTDVKDNDALAPQDTSDVDADYRKQLLIKATQLGIDLNKGATYLKKTSIDELTTQDLETLIDLKTRGR